MQKNPNNHFPHPDSVPPEKGSLLNQYRDLYPNNPQAKAPLAEILQLHREKQIIHFDVPGHKQGKGNPDLTDFLGEKALSIDVGSMKMVDNLIQPVSVIKEAEELAAAAFSAHDAFFMVNGTTSAIQAMIMSSLNPGDELILPRNVHRSIINGLILAHAKPVYVNPGVHAELGIPLGMSAADVEQAIKDHPHAKAVLVNHPTYYGICSNLKEITRLAHQANMLVLVDGAHGTHFQFGHNYPISAMEAGVDMAAHSVHKTGGSLTQSSILLLGEGVRDKVSYIRQVVNLTQTTSASYLLMVSLDLTRRMLALRGKEIFERVSRLADYARDEVNKIGGYYAFSKEAADGDAFFDFDPTKLSVHTRYIGLTGQEVHDHLRDEYNILPEFGDLSNFLAIISIGDSPAAIDKLIAALKDIKERYGKKKADLLASEYVEPEVVMMPTEAFYSKTDHVPLLKAEGRIAAESIMAYPPGIPILAPGERVTGEVIDYIEYARINGSLLTGTKDPRAKNLLVVR